MMSRCFKIMVYLDSKHSTKSCLKILIYIGGWLYNFVAHKDKVRTKHSKTLPFKAHLYQ